MGALCMWMCVCVSCCLDSRSRFAQRLLNLRNANLNKEQRTLQDSRWRRTCDQENSYISRYFFCLVTDTKIHTKFWKQIARVISQPRKGKWQTRVLSCIQKNCVICVVIRTFQSQGTAEIKILSEFLMSGPTTGRLEDAFGGWVQCARVALIRSITNFKAIPRSSAPHIPLYFMFLRSKYRMCSSYCLRSDLLQQTVQTKRSHRLKKTEECFTSVCYNSTSHKDTDSMIHPHCRAEVLLTELIINTR
jgi:hypothetical protein